MLPYKNPYISRVQIKNFRNFLDADVQLDHKQVIIGENNVGKTNFLRAIQLILDKDFSDNDRQLSESDFHDSIVDPMIAGAEIEIILQIKGYEHNSKLVAQFTDALISSAPPTLQFRYLFSPNLGPLGNILNYNYEIYKGKGDQTKFTSEDRRFINIYVIKALRDVERELKANKHSPLYKLVKKYDISKDDLEDISEAMETAASELLELDEIVHIRETIQERFTSLSGLQSDNEISLRTFDIDTERLLYTLQVYMGLKGRPVAELSLGLANLLYISLMLILLKDRTIQPIIKLERYAELLENDEDDLLTNYYTHSNKGNYKLNPQLSESDLEKLYTWMDEQNGNQQAFTILAVEEPEAHLHPSLQRLVFREVLHKSSTSVIFTTHSTFIGSVAPLSTIVHVRKVDGASKIYSTANLTLDQGEKQDIERYIDAKRGEIYFGKGIILAEGITEEYIIPASANLMGTPLDDLGIIICNINSTNFKPYVQLLNALNIPWILITDGDYYENEISHDPDTGEEIKNKKYHIMSSGNRPGYSGGIKTIKRLLNDLNILNTSEIPDNATSRYKFIANGCFVGRYTLEVDMMNETNGDGRKVIMSVYSSLISGGKKMKNNFENAIESGAYWDALQKIEDNISKGRFAQRLAGNLIPELIPGYLIDGITTMIRKVKLGHE